MLYCFCQVSARYKQKILQLQKLHEKYIYSLLHLLLKYNDIKVFITIKTLIMHLFHYLLTIMYLFVHQNI